MFDNIGLFILLGTAITRIGAVLLLIFGAQVLINFYRYNLRLAAFYDSRADAIELLGEGSIGDLLQLVSSLSPDQLEMGKIPKTPSQEVVELATAIAKLQKLKA